MIVLANVHVIITGLLFCEKQEVYYYGFNHGCLCANAFQQIERIQNINLRRLYEARKSELEIKNDPAVGAGEKILYHGSAQASCSSIMSTNFNRNFAGQNGN